MLHNQNRAHLRFGHTLWPRFLNSAGERREKSDKVPSWRTAQMKFFSFLKPQQWESRVREGEEEGQRGKLHPPVASVSHSIISRLLCNRGTDSWEESHSSVVKLTGNSGPQYFSFTIFFTLSLLSKPCVRLLQGLGGTQGHRGERSSAGVWLLLRPRGPGSPSEPRWAPTRGGGAAVKHRVEV